MADNIKNKDIQFDNTIKAVHSLLNQTMMDKLTNNDFIYTSLVSMIQSALDFQTPNTKAAIYPVQVAQMANYLVMSDSEELKDLKSEFKHASDEYKVDDPNLIATMFVFIVLRQFLENQLNSQGLKVVGKIDDDMGHFFMNKPICEIKQA